MDDVLLDFFSLDFGRLPPPTRSGEAVQAVVFAGTDKDTVFPEVEEAEEADVEEGVEDVVDIGMVHNEGEVEDAEDDAAEDDAEDVPNACDSVARAQDAAGRIQTADGTRSVVSSEIWRVRVWGSNGVVDNRADASPPCCCWADG